MTIQQGSWGVAAFGALTTLFLLIGVNTVGGLMALVQLCFLVGAPLAFVMFDELRSWQVVGVVAVALSLALSAISVQFLIWFRIATPVYLVIMATAYGVVLALLFSPVDLLSDDGDLASGDLTAGDLAASETDSELPDIAEDSQA